MWWRAAALDRCRRWRQGKSQLHRRHKLRKNSSVRSIAARVSMEMSTERGQDPSRPGQGSHACCARRRSSETVVRCSCFSGALAPNKRVARTVTRWFLTSRRQSRKSTPVPNLTSRRSPSVRVRAGHRSSLLAPRRPRPWNALAARTLSPAHAAGRFPSSLRRLDAGPRALFLRAFCTVIVNHYRKSQCILITLHLHSISATRLPATYIAVPGGFTTAIAFNNAVNPDRVITPLVPPSFCRRDAAMIQSSILRLPALNALRAMDPNSSPLRGQASAKRMIPSSYGNSTTESAVGGESAEK